MNSDRRITRILESMDVFGVVIYKVEYSDGTTEQLTLDRQNPTYQHVFEEFDRRNSNPNRNPPNRVHGLVNRTIQEHQEMQTELSLLDVDIQYNSTDIELLHPEIGIVDLINNIQTLNNLQFQSSTDATTEREISKNKKEDQDKKK